MSIVKTNNFYKIKKNRHIYFSNSFNEYLEDIHNFAWYDKNNLLVTHITFGKNFNKTINNLPDSILYIRFGKYFNSTITNYPNKLRYLHFGSEFDKPINDLPESLTYLHFGTKFNQIIFNFPINLRYLHFGENFSQSVDNILPESLEILFFELYNKNKKRNKKNTNNSSFNKSTQLISDESSDNMNDYNLDSAMEVLNTEYNTNTVTITYSNTFSFSHSYKELLWDIIRNERCKIINLPSNLKKLQLNSTYLYNKINNLPIGLCELTIPQYKANMISKIPFNCKVACV